MASTYPSLHYHIVFGTKDRMPRIDTSWRPRLHEHLGGTVHGLGGIPEAIGGVTDLIHLLAGLKATHCLADFVSENRDLQTACKLPGRLCERMRTFYASNCVIV